MEARQRFGDWIVLDSTLISDARYHKVILCFDEIANEIGYIRVDFLEENEDEIKAGNLDIKDHIYQKALILYKN